MEWLAYYVGACFDRVTRSGDNHDTSSVSDAYWHVSRVQKPSVYFSPILRQTRLQRATQVHL